MKRGKWSSRNIDKPTFPAAQDPAESTHDTRGKNRRLETEWIADGNHHLPRFQCGGYGYSINSRLRAVLIGSERSRVKV